MLRTQNLINLRIKRIIANKRACNWVITKRIKSNSDNIHRNRIKNKNSMKLYLLMSRNHLRKVLFLLRRNSRFIQHFQLQRENRDSSFRSLECSSSPFSVRFQLELCLSLPVFVLGLFFLKKITNFCFNSIHNRHCPRLILRIKQLV